MVALSTPQYGNRRSSSESASKSMRGNRSKGTQPELILRRAIWARGLRYRLHDRRLPGKPDLVFRGGMVAVFCDGDFWHGRNWRLLKKQLSKRANPDYWVPKIQANIDRDKKVTAQLRAAGWVVIRVWESDVKEDPDVAADLIEAAVSSVRMAGSR